MALAQRTLSNKKQKVLAAALAGVLLTTGLVAYFGLFRDTTPPASAPVSGLPTAPETPLPKVPPRAGVDALRELRSSPAWQSLRPFGAPLPLEPKGRSDPFIVPPPVTEQELKERTP